MAAHTTLVDLLRHGETERGAGFRGSTDDALTPRGLEQMRAAIEEECTWNWIVTSPLRRCADFARELGRRRRIPVETEQRLQEIHFGAWETKSAEQLTAEDRDGLPRFWSDPSRHPPPGGETLARFQERVVSSWKHQIRRHAGQRILIVSHAGPIRVILCHVLEIAIAELLRFEVPHASVTRIQVDSDAEGRTRARRLGDVGSRAC
ncbi:MAG TPA: alpha-ribazole phosphatase family protein [Burkholderiales bacterium]|nr:alpha-ribazole phosphatase family protein [Burkholderiales bacterium]